MPYQEINNLFSTIKSTFKASFLNKRGTSTLLNVYFLTFSTELIVMFSNLLTFKLAALLLGAEGFGKFMIARRAMNIIAFSMLMGLGISLPRYIALRNSSENVTENISVTYFLASFLLMVPTAAIFSVSALVWASEFTSIFFGENGYDDFALAIILITIGLQLHTLVYSFFRGVFRIIAANLLRIFSFGIVPPAAILLAQGDAFNSLVVMGITWICINLIVSLKILSTVSIRAKELCTIKTCIMDLMRYGLPRVPGEFALFGLFSIPVFIVSHKSGVEEAGYLSFSLSLLQIFGGLFGFIGIILLPRISQLKGKREWEQIGRIVNSVLLVTAIGSIVLTSLLYLGFDHIIILFMGKEFHSKISHFNIVLISIIPYSFYIVLRNPIDALVVKPYNSINLFLTLSFIILLLAFGNSTAFSMSMVIALFLLAILTIISWRKSYAHY